MVDWQNKSVGHLDQTNSVFEPTLSTNYSEIWIDLNLRITKNQSEPSWTCLVFSFLLPNQIFIAPPDRG